MNNLYLNTIALLTLKCRMSEKSVYYPRSGIQWTKHEDNCLIQHRISNPRETWRETAKVSAAIEIYNQGMLLIQKSFSKELVRLLYRDMAR